VGGVRRHFPPPSINEKTIKICPPVADEASEEALVMKYEVRKERSSHRVPMIPHEPAYLLCSVDGINIDPVVEDLGGGGARLVCPTHFDLFREGQLI